MGHRNLRMDSSRPLRSAGPWGRARCRAARSASARAAPRACGEGSFLRLTWRRFCVCFFGGGGGTLGEGVFVVVVFFLPGTLWWTLEFTNSFLLATFEVPG